MIGLAALEDAFQAYLLAGDTRILPHLRGNARLGAPDLMAVYGHAYRTRLLEALANDFPGLYGLLGADDFAALAGDYLAAHPSRFPSLRWLGRDLPEFLERHPHPAHPLAAGMARFDWAVAQAFDALDQAPVTLAEVFALPMPSWDGLRLAFAAAVSDFTADAVIGDLRHALLRGGERLPASGRRQRWLVWRQGEQVQFRPMATDEAGCYDLMRDGGGFGAMCAALAAQRDQTDAVTRGAEILKDWLERGLVAAIAGAAP